MTQNDFDKKIKEALLKKTDEILSVQEELKRKLEQQLFIEKERTMKKSKRKRGKVAFLISFAAVLVLSFVFFQTDAGYALVDKVKSLFEPEKKIIQEIEGQEEETDVQLQEGKEAKYVIYIDEERYRFEGDLITTKEPLGEPYPEVSMEIIQELEKSKEEVIEAIKEELADKGYIVAFEQEVDDPKSGYVIYSVADEKREWNTPVEKYFILTEENHLFVFKQKFFVEAEEGHGARFSAMIKDFHIVE